MCTRTNSLFVFVVLVGIVLAVSVALATPARADDFGTYFPHGMTVSRDALGNWTVEFDPVLDKNGYKYEIQVAGKKAVKIGEDRGQFGERIDKFRWDLTAIRFGAGYNQRVGIATIEAKFDAAGKVLSGGGGLTANVGTYFGGWHNRWAGDVTNEVHLRVRVSNQNGDTLYTTSWYKDDDIMKWNWPRNLSWVQEKKR